ncbi:WD40 repeat-like protein [Anaeromyces robustus]|uniref:WD40 repeat-like protein n=1 Tax=Anaeromyces robustus TaxID=1754192 RepID=A0A1Y1WT73_9FUNG|nr:WD40 repeat-like protein [Anaeromyces robustus]|eukprot:ORX76737.1 WD40 repeat-like protein [Anaeromyces robustus]
MDNIKRNNSKNKGKKAFNYKKNRNRSNSDFSQSNNEKKNHFKYIAGSSSNTTNNNNTNTNNNSNNKFGTNTSTKKNKCKRKASIISNDNNSHYTNNNKKKNGNINHYNSNSGDSLSKSLLKLKLKQSFNAERENKKNYSSSSSRHFKNKSFNNYGNGYGYEASSSSNSNSYYHSNHYSSTSTSEFSNSNSNNLTHSSSDNNNEPNILNIPGYYYDKEKKKYFKIQKNGLSTSNYSQSLVTQKIKEEKNKQQQDLEKIKIKIHNKDNNIRALLLNRELGTIIGENNIEKYIYNKLFSNIKCKRTTRHQEISHISLSSSGKIIALGHINGYASIKVQGNNNNENSLYSCAKIASSKVSSIKVYENDNINYHIFATSLGGEAEPGTLNIYKYNINNHNDEFIPVFSLVKKVTYKNSTIQCCSISNSLESFITLGDRFNALIHSNINSICSDIKYNTISMPTKTDILVQKSTNNHLLYNGCRNGSIEIIDLQNLKLNTSKNFIKHKSSVCDIQQINDNLFISNSMDGKIYIWDIRGGTTTINSKFDHNKNWIVQELYGNINEYLKNNIAINSFKNTIVTAGQDGQVRAWNINSGEMVFSKHLPNYVNNTTTTIQIDQSDSLISFWTANSVNLSLWNLRF